MPDLPETKQIHSDMLLLLEKFDAICRENNIMYSLHGGTLLGCIRERGFIPWDDDIDVSMRREEYEKLSEVFSKTLLDSELRLDTQTNRFPQLWLKLPGREPVWLDIFIWDYISERKAVQKLKIAGLCFFLSFLKTGKTMDLSSKSGKYKGWKHIVIWLGYQLGRLFPMEKKLRWADSFSQKLCGKKQFINRSNDLYAGMKLILPDSVMSAYESRPFETLTLLVSSSYDAILTSSYGADYMTPKRMTDAESYTHSLARDTLS